MPNNIKILQMANHRETEHGFVIFQKINPAIDTIRGSLVFIQSRIAIRVFKNSKGRIKDISHWEHDVSISEEFWLNSLTLCWEMLLLMLMVNNIETGIIIMNMLSPYLIL